MKMKREEVEAIYKQGVCAGHERRLAKLCLELMDDKAELLERRQELLDDKLNLLATNKRYRDFIVSVRASCNDKTILNWQALAEHTLTKEE